MATINFSVKQRPVRIGFVVRHGEITDLRKAASLCTLLWGGVHNPIVPVRGPRDRFADQLIDLFQVDVLHAIAHSDQVDTFLARYPYRQSPDIGARDLFREEWRSKKLDVSYLDTINIVERYWDKDFKHKPADYRSNCAFLTWHADDELAALFALSYGAYPTEYALADDFRKAFVRGLRAQEIDIPLGQALAPDLATFVCPIQLTALDLRGYGGASRDWDGVYFGSPADFSDLVNFWNLRAAGNSIQFGSLATAARTDAVLQAHIKKVDELPNRHSTIEDRIHFTYRQENHERVLELLKSFGTKKPKALNGADDVIWNGMNVRPREFAFDWENTPAIVDQEFGAYGVTVTLPPKKFLADSEDRAGRQFIAVSLKALGEFGYPGYTLAVPYRSELNEFYSRNIGIDPYAVRSEREGIGVLLNAGDNSVHLRPIAKRAVADALLRTAKIKTEASQPGRLADRLLDKLGGLEGARVFKIRGVRNLIGGLGANNAISRGEATKIIWNEGQFKDHEDLYIERREKASLKISDAFDYMLKKEFFRAGLELTCDHCGLISWQSLKQIDDVWTCEFCGHQNTTSLHIRDRGDWRFRKSGLLAKDNNQEGAVPVLLSLLALRRLLEHGPFIYTTSMKLHDGTQEAEFDFVALQYGRDNEIHFILGEAKSGGGRIEREDVENARRLVHRLSEYRMKVAPAFVKAADAFQPEEIELFRALQRDGIPPILFTNRELEPYHPYWEKDEKDPVPHKYAVTIEDLTRNSAHRYLREQSDRRS